VTIAIAYNSNALGSKVELVAGGRTQTRWIYSGGSFVSASAQVAHFEGEADQHSRLPSSWLADAVTKAFQPIYASWR